MTAEEFLDRDDGDHSCKLVCVEGRVRAMSPANATHGPILANIAFPIGPGGTAALEGLGAELPMADVYAGTHLLAAQGL